MRILLPAVLVLVTACGDGFGPQEPETEPAPADIEGAMVGAPGVSIDSVAIYQGLRRSLYQREGATVQGLVLTGREVEVPILAEREALIRVFTSLDDSFNGNPVIARLHLGDEVVTKVVADMPGWQHEGAPNSTLNFYVSAAQMVEGLEYRVELLQARDSVPGHNPAALHPPDQSMDSLQVSAKTSALRIVLVPVVYKGRSPDTSDEQLARYWEGFMDQFPATAVDISLREPYAFSGSMSSSGEGWDDLLTEIADLRDVDGVDEEVYYYGLVNPGDTRAQYCNRGCVAGLGFLTDLGFSFGRAAIGLGFSGRGSVDTAVHELGHNHGRPHAPCGGPAGIDSGFPHKGGHIGTWGLRVSDNQVFQPGSTKDFMGYCAKTWVSDYTYASLYRRMRGVDAQVNARSLNATQRYGRTLVRGDGSVSALPPAVLSVVPANRSFTARNATGLAEYEGYFAPFDHGDGGLLIYPLGDEALEVVGLGDAPSVHAR